MQFSGTRPVIFFWDTILAWGTQAVIWGGERIRNSLRGAGPELDTLGVPPYQRANCQLVKTFVRLQFHAQCRPTISLLKPTGSLFAGEAVHLVY